MGAGVSEGRNAMAGDEKHLGKGMNGGMRRSEGQRRGGLRSKFRTRNDRLSLT